MQLTARQIGMNHHVLDAIETLVDRPLEANRKKDAA
jgi:hypothetical protein